MNAAVERPLIAVICPEMNSTVSEIVRGISCEALNKNMSTAFFSVFSETFDEDTNRKYEENIYSLINFDIVSGVVFLESEFWTERLRNKVKRIITEKCRVPVISTGTENSEIITASGINIYSSDGIYETVSHLIEVHSCRDIFFLAGPKGNKVSEERINGYMRCMKAHGITPDTGSIFYGDFWYDYPVKLAERIASGKVKRPQAVACANDAMACALIRALDVHNIKVPDDILVTGFDGSEESIFCSPSLATFFPPYFEQGREYIRKLQRMINRRKEMPPEKHHGIFAPGGSCGCLSCENPMLDLRKKNIYERNRSIEYLTRSDMNEKCFMASDMESFITAVDQSTYLIPGYERMFLCLKSNLYTSVYEYEERYPEKMTVMLDKIEFVKVCRNISFRTEKMLPVLYSDREKNNAYFFFPVQFAGKSFGYMAVTYTDKQEIPGKPLEIWVRNISAALWRISSCSASSVKKTETTYEENEANTANLAPRWVFDLMNEMKKPENFTAGVPRMILLSHVSSEHLSRTFRKYIGITPTEFVNDIKLEYAAMLIHDGKFEITEACFASGFSNLSHFYHKFKDKFGCSPKQYKVKNAETE